MNEQITKRIILLDGAKGAGKSTVSDLLAKRLPHTAFLSLDKERRSLPNQKRTRTELNQEAFEIILEKTKSFLKKNMSVVIDCGMTEKRLSNIDSLAKSEEADVYKFLLKAPHDTLLERVRGRDSSKGNATDEKRFEEVFRIIHSKNFEEYEVIETHNSTPDEIGHKIIKFLQ